jgi:hypothetical protein
MRPFVLPLLATFLLSTSVFADCTGVENCLGFYFDNDGWSQTCVSPAPFVPFS